MWDEREAYACATRDAAAENARWRKEFTKKHTRGARPRVSRTFFKGRARPESMILTQQRETIRAATILVIEDEPEVRDIVAGVLHAVADRVLQAADGRSGVALAMREHPDVIVLDLGLPDLSGIDVSHALRIVTSAPIIVLSARDREEDKIELLTAGADDYLTKPFGSGELLARVRAHLRREQLTPASTMTKLQADWLEIDYERGGVSRDGVRLRLTRLEWRLLRTLSRHPGRTLTHQQLFDTIWARSYGNAQQYLRVHVTSLRRKIERNPATPRLIVTEPGVGYRFEIPQP